jgi:hypothetical protein
MWRQEAYKFSGHPLNDEQGANMTDLRKAAEMALAKFEHLWEIGIDAEYKVELLPEIKALRQAIEQAEKQEPVAYKYTDKTNPLVFYFTERKGKDVTQNPDAIETALYTAPQQREWVGLTDDEIALYDKRLSGSGVARAIEAKLKEKNGG